MRRTCDVSGKDCIAPAGYGTWAGHAEGDKSTSLTCYVCGQPVCSACSKLKHRNIGPRRPARRVRVCLNCEQC